MSRTVLPWNALPTNLPVQTTALAGLLLDRFSAPGWVWGVVGTLMALVWIVAVVRLCTDRVKPLPGYGAP